MKSIIQKLIDDARSNDEQVYIKALSDLRMTIERLTMDRYSEEEKHDYHNLFYNKELVDFKLSNDELQNIKYFLVYLLFSSSDRSVLVAKCVKVLFDPNLSNAICNALEIYIEDDITTSELLYAIIDESPTQKYFQNQRIMQMFTKLKKSGGAVTREIINRQISLREML